MKQYLIYKTINTKTGQFYIGAHETYDITDQYLGSGKLLKEDIKRFGKSIFNKVILKECSSRKEMYEYETKIIEEHINDPLCYNINDGGKGGWNYVNESGILFGKNNPMKNPDVAKRCGEKTAKTKKADPKYKKIAIKNLQAAIKKNTGTKKPKHSSFMQNWSTNNWKENHSKMRDSLSSWFLVIDPTGNQEKTNRLQDFCKERGLGYTSLWNTTRTGKVVSKGKSKGWSCRLLS